MICWYRQNERSGARLHSIAETYCSLSDRYAYGPADMTPVWTTHHITMKGAALGKELLIAPDHNPDGEG